MPSLPVLCSWVIAIGVTLTSRACFARADAGARLAARGGVEARGIWDEGDEPSPARVVVAGDRLHVRVPRRRRLVLQSTEAHAAAGLSADATLSRKDDAAWKVELGAGRALLADSEGSIWAAVDRFPVPPSRLGWRSRLFLHAPRWFASALIGALALGVGMTALTAVSEHHVVEVTRVMASDDSLECEVRWTGKTAEGPHATACPDDEDQRAGDMVTAVRLPASEYVVALDETHLSFVAFMSFMAAALFLVLTMIGGVISALIPARKGSYARVGTEGANLGHRSVEADARQDDALTQDLTSPEAWSEFVEPDVPTSPPAHSGTWRRRLAWRLEHLPLPWFWAWLLAVSVYHWEDHRPWLIPVAAAAAVGVAVGLFRTIVSWRNCVQTPPAGAPRHAYRYVRLPATTQKRTIAPVTAVLIFGANEASLMEGGAWIVDLDGRPAAEGLMEFVGTVAAPDSPRVAIDGIQYEMSDSPEWIDETMLEEIRDGVLWRRAAGLS